MRVNSSRFQIPGLASQDTDEQRNRIDSKMTFDVTSNDHAGIYRTVTRTGRLAIGQTVVRQRSRAVAFARGR